MLENRNAILLRSLCLNAPILRVWGYMPKIPFALVCSEFADAIEFAQMLSPNPRILDGFSQIREIEEALGASRSDGVFLIVERATAISAKMQAKIDAIFAAARFGKVCKKTVHAAVFLIFRRMVPEEYREQVFEIHLEKWRAGTDFNMLRLVPDSNQLSLVNDKIRELKKGEKGIGTLKAAAGFLYPKLAELGRITDYKLVLEACERLEHLAKMYQEESGVAELLTESFFNYIENSSDIRVYALPYIGRDAENHFEESFFIKGDQFYIHESFFMKIIAPVMEVVPIGMIKDTLVKADLLKCDSGGYTAKMSYYYEKNRLLRRRMLRFCGEKIRQEEGTSFIKILRTYQF